MLNIQLDEIKEKGLLLEGEVSPDAFPLLNELKKEDDARFVGSIRYRLKLGRLVGLVEVTGKVEADSELTCSRCLKSFRLPVSTNFSLAYTEQLPEYSVDDDDEIELSAEEMGLILLEGDEISLLEPLQEQLFLTLPIQPLCQGGCKGLCPICGNDLNDTSCGCKEPLFDERFSSLKNFKVNN